MSSGTMPRAAREINPNNSQRSRAPEAGRLDKMGHRRRPPPRRRWLAFGIAALLPRTTERVRTGVGALMGGATWCSRTQAKNSSKSLARTAHRRAAAALAPSASRLGRELEGGKGAAKASHHGIAFATRGAARASPSLQKIRDPLRKGGLWLDFCLRAALPRHRGLLTLAPCKHTAPKQFCPRMASSRCGVSRFAAVSLSRSSSFQSPLSLRRFPPTRCGVRQSRCSRPLNPWRTLTGRLLNDCARYPYLGLVGSRRLGAHSFHPCSA